MRLTPVFAIAAFLLTTPAQAQSLKEGEVYSSFAVQPVSEPNPVLGADGRVHLAYELLFTNPSKLFITLDTVEARNGKVSVYSLEGERLAAMTIPYAGGGRTLPPGGTAIVLLDVSLAEGEALPSEMSARVTATRQLAGTDGKPAPFPASEPLPATTTFIGAATPVGAPAVVVAPPLRGSGWVAVNGCCDAITSHRGAVMAVNGRVRVPERFAIDWVKLDDSGHLASGDGSKVEDYAYYGAPVYAAADGVVVNLYNGADEQIPNGPISGITTESIGGNMLVVDIGGGAFAFYAHLQRDSLKVKLGDQVRTGDVIGLLGNTGNTTAPHLHFHVMDGPSPLNANGLPYVFTRFKGTGFIAPGSDDYFAPGKKAQIDARLAGEHVNQLPLNDQVVTFE